MAKKELIFDRKLPEGKSKAEHYSQLVDLILSNIADCDANYLVICSNLLPVFMFSDKTHLRSADDIGVINGPYHCGYLGDTPIVVSPTQPLGIALLCRGDYTKAFLQPEYADADNKLNTIYRDIIETLDPDLRDALRVVYFRGTRAYWNELDRVAADDTVMTIKVIW